MSTLRSFPPLIVAFAASVAVNAIGAIVALSTHLVGFGQAVLNGSAVSSPLPFLTVHALFALAAVRASRRATALAAATIVVLMGLVALVSGFGDGSYFDSGLSIAERCVQAAVVISIVGVIVAAVAQVARVSRLRATPGI